MERRRPPQTDEGWYVLHDCRSVDWDSWRETAERERERAIAEGIEYFSACEALDDASEGCSGTFSILGHKADLMTIHLRPSMADLDVLERRFERTALADFTERVDSYVSVTEVSGYMSQEYFEEDSEVEDTGLARYIDSRLKPEMPDTEYVNFYPMDKRRDDEWNWYDLDFEERAEYISGHGDIGREYAGKVTQIITSSVGFDDHEWGVTLFADDPTDIKDLLYEMRFDPSSSRFAEFGRFLFGRQLPPENLGIYLDGEPVPQEPVGQSADSHGGGHPEHGSSGDQHTHGGHEADGATDDHGDDIRTELEEMGVYAGSPHGEDVHAIVLYSAADPDELFEEVDGLRTNFDHYDTHVKTAVYEPSVPNDGADGAAVDGTSTGEETAIVSLWDTERAANTAAGFLADLPDIVRQAGDGEDSVATEHGDGAETSDSWGTMGMFYTVKPDYREEFTETFAQVGGLLADMDGHRKTDLLVNRENELDMFIASRWDSREDAMAFFRSEAFSDTVEWGRDVLTDRPRHVFLA